MQQYEASHWTDQVAWLIQSSLANGEFEFYVTDLPTEDRGLYEHEYRSCRFQI